MNNLNFPVAHDFIPFSNNNWVKNSLEKHGDVNRIVQRKEKLNLTLTGKLGGKIKFILGFIYFFSLLFFSIMLFN